MGEVRRQGEMRTTVLTVALLANGAAAFAPASHALALRSAPSARCLRASGAATLSMAVDDSSRQTRREALMTSTTAALALFAQTKTANAAGKALGYGLSEKDANAQLAAYGLQGMDKVPGGFKPLLMPVGGTVGANIDGSKVMHKNGHIIIHVSIARRRETDRETDMRTQVRVYDLT